MNPFQSGSIAESEELKRLFKELRAVVGRICLQYAEDYGEKLNMDHVHRAIYASTDFDIIMFKTYAYQFLNNQPETSLSVNDCIASAAYDAYIQVKQL